MADTIREPVSGRVAEIEEDRPLRIAQVIGYPNIGGAERHFVNLVNALEGQQRTAIFVSQDRGLADLRDVLDPSVEQVHLPIRRRHIGRDLRRLTALLRQCRCDVVHTHMFWASLFGAVSAHWAETPVLVTTEHGENRWKGWHHRWLERHVISRYADRRLCVSQAILDRRVQTDGVPRRLLELTANGTLLPTLEGDRKASSEPTIGSVGRLVPEKDYRTLVFAVAKLRDAGVRFRLCLVGDGPERSTLENQVRNLDLTDHVEFAGAVKDVDSWYRRFDIFVLSSVQEGLPVALLEAMSYGIPCVATAVGAVDTVIAADDEGTLVPPSSPEALASAIETYLKDPDLSSRHGAAARDRIRVQFSIEAIAARHLELYRRLLWEKHCAA